MGLFNSVSMFYNWSQEVSKVQFIYISAWLECPRGFTCRATTQHTFCGGWAKGIWYCSVFSCWLAYWQVGDPVYSSWCKVSGNVLYLTYVFTEISKSARDQYSSVYSNLLRYGLMSDTVRWYSICTVLYICKYYMYKLYVHRYIPMPKSEYD
jgi:hypothetical protein